METVHVAVADVIAMSLSQSACVNGIPPPDGWAPPEVKPCHVVVTQDRRQACITRGRFVEWRRMNGLLTSPGRRPRMKHFAWIAAALLSFNAFAHHGWSWAEEEQTEPKAPSNPSPCRRHTRSSR